MHPPLPFQKPGSLVRAYRIQSASEGIELDQLKPAELRIPGDSAGCPVEAGVEDPLVDHFQIRARLHAP